MELLGLQIRIMKKDEAIMDGLVLLFKSEKDLRAKKGRNNKDIIQYNLYFKYPDSIVYFGYVMATMGVTPFSYNSIHSVMQ